MNVAYVICICILLFKHDMCTHTSHYDLPLALTSLDLPDATLGSLRLSNPRRKVAPH